MVITAGPPAFVTIATRRPRGSRPARLKPWAKSCRSEKPCARSTPHCRKTASIVSSVPASEPVWELIARCPRSLVPTFRVMNGLTRVSRRAASTKRGPSAMPSR